jgi:serine/threonine-protein kinase
VADHLHQLKSVLADRYRIERVLGRGGMATVYLAEDLKHHRRVAVKVLHPELATALGPERFLREIEIAARLNHPHILPLFDSGETDGFLYYVMPYVDGESLRDRLNREGQLPIDDAIHITREITEALTHAHGQGLMHRDIKPENVLMSEGHALVADFGIARAVSQAGGDQLTQTGIAIGSPAYMSPEQSAGDPRVDARSDIYSLGCILYEMLVGQIPFPAPTAQAMMARHSIEQVPAASVMRPAVSRELEETIHYALAKNPADRFKTAREFAGALAALEKGEAPRLPTSVGRQPRSAATSVPVIRRALVPGLAAILLVIAAVVGWQLATSGVTGRGTDPGAPGAASFMAIAVFPFENASDDPSNEYFGEGLADELVDALSGIDGLRVAARRSTRALKLRSASPLEIASELNVQAILEGSVRRTGDEVSVTARLVDAEEGFQLWSERFDRAVNDAFAIQGEIARAVVVAIHRQLGRTVEVPPLDPITQDPMAHDKYLWGQFNLNRRTEEGARDAVDNFTMAIGFDSAFANAHAGLADAQLALAERSAQARTPRTLEAARAAAEAALRLSPSLARARGALGSVKFKAFDWRGAEAEYVRALEATSDDPSIRQRYAELLASLGRVDDALLHARVAVERDRLSPGSWHTLLHVLRARGQYADAVKAGQEMLKLNPNDPEPWLDLGLLFLLEGRRPAAEAGDALERYAELRGGDPAAFRSVAFAADATTASRVPPEVAAMLIGRPVQLAVFHQIVGDREAALSTLERAHREAHPDLASLLTRPELARLRGHPRFRAILADLRLTAP